MRSESLAQVPILNMFTNTTAMRRIGLLKQQGVPPTVPCGLAYVPSLSSVTGDIVIALHLVYEVSHTYCLRTYVHEYTHVTVLTNAC